jgi:hypothetical protein
MLRTREQQICAAIDRRLHAEVGKKKACRMRASHVTEAMATVLADTERAFYAAVDANSFVTASPEMLDRWAEVLGVGSGSRDPLASK